MFDIALLDNEVFHTLTALFFAPGNYLAGVFARVAPSVFRAGSDQASFAEHGPVALGTSILFWAILLTELWVLCRYLLKLYELVLIKIRTWSQRIISYLRRMRISKACRMETNATLHDQTVVQEIASLDDLALRALSLAERQGNVSAITTEQLRLSSGARIRDIQRALMLLQELQFISPTNTRAENPAYEVTAAGKMYLRACDS